jgi:SAM-dependent methyltransferase
MHPESYPQMASLEASHWWFVARRQILKSVLNRFTHQKSMTILEVGAGTGGNVAMLESFGPVTLLEPNPVARSILSQKGFSVIDGTLPGVPPLPEKSVDLIAMLDVLEHIDDDEAALRTLRPLLSPEGKILLTVPAFAWLWSHHDVYHHHKRRYSRQDLEAVLARAGYTLEFLSSFNTLLFPLVVLARLWARLWGEKNHSDMKMPPLWLNTLLKTIFALERHVLGRGRRLPVGVSLLVVAKPATRQP